MIPKFHLLYFKNLLDLAFTRFFEVFESKFAKIDNEYVLLQAIDRSSIQSFFEEVIVEELKKIIVPYDVVKNPNYYIIIGACNPKDNFLLEFKKGFQYFPAKLDKLLSRKFQIKYLLKERDIRIDIEKFNQSCIDVFNDFFVGDATRRKFGDEYSNLVFMTHKRLDCYSMFKVLKYIFGKANCINMHESQFKNARSPIVAINDLIDKYATNKIQANRDKRFKDIVKEIQQFIELKIGFKR